MSHAFPSPLISKLVVTFCFQGDITDWSDPTIASDLGFALPKGTIQVLARSAASLLGVLSLSRESFSDCVLPSFVIYNNIISCSEHTLLVSSVVLVGHHPGARALGGLGHDVRHHQLLPVSCSADTLCFAISPFHQFTKSQFYQISTSSECAISTIKCIPCENTFTRALP